MNRADWGMVLDQANNLGDTMLRNRMMKQQETQRAADVTRQQSQFDDTMALRREENTATATHRTEQAAELKLQSALKQMAVIKEDMIAGMRDLAEQARAKGPEGNAWARQQMEGIMAALPDDMRHEMEKNPQFKTILAPEFDWTAMGVTPPAQMTDVPGGRIAPNRTFIPDRLNPKEDFQLKDLQEQLKAVRQKKSDLEGQLSQGGPVGSSTNEGNNMRRMRKLNEQEAQLKQQVEQILTRFAPMANQEQDPDDSEYQDEAQYEAELKLALEALKLKADPATVAKKFKARTGRDLPQ